MGPLKVVSGIVRMEQVAAGALKIWDTDHPQGIHVDVAGTVRFRPISNKGAFVTLTLAVGDYNYEVDAIDLSQSTATGVYGLFV